MNSNILPVGRLFVALFNKLATLFNGNIGIAEILHIFVCGIEIVDEYLYVCKYHIEANDG